MPVQTWRCCVLGSGLSTIVSPPTTTSRNSTDTLFDAAPFAVMTALDPGFSTTTYVTPPHVIGNDPVK
jgi:hypothetical protein